MVIGSDPIPNWDSNGLLPPFVGSPTSSSSRSPYRVPLTDMILRFGNTATRRELLAGFLDFRASLHAAGLLEGFQWVNGSFVENIIQTRRREPRDIDVVTFLHLPKGYTQTTFYQAFPDLFDRSANRAKYSTDTLFAVLSVDDPYYLVRRTTYLSSLWSHTRHRQWKGYLEVDLSDSEDRATRSVLNRMDNEEARQ